MTQVYYRKYRPASFNDVIGLSSIKAILNQQIKENKISHAYLFTGPRGTGKTTVARLFAKEVNNAERLDELDIIEIDAASNRGIDDIRELKEKITFVPSHSRFKVYIIDEVHMLTKEAFNALLKTLEEPPEHVIFILATTEPHKIPTTILSRVLRFDFRLASIEELESKFAMILKKEKVKHDKEAVKLVAKLSRGSFRDGESLLAKLVNSLEGKKLTLAKAQEVLGYSDYQLVSSFLEHINNSNTEEALKVLNQVLKDGRSIYQFGFQVLDELRELIYKTVSQTSNSEWKLRDLGMIAKEISLATNESKSATIPELPFELAVIKLTEDKISTKSVASKSSTQGSKTLKKTVSFAAFRKNEPKKKNDSIEELATFVVDHDIKINQIIEIWSSIIDRLKELNHHLAAFLVKAKPSKFEKGYLVMCVPFEFHRKKLEDTTNKKTVINVMEEYLKIRLNYVVTVDPSLLPTLNTSEEMESNENMVEEIFDV